MQDEEFNEEVVKRLKASLGTSHMDRIVPAGPRMQFIPPGRFSNEQLEQIRAVMREELEKALGVLTEQVLTEQENLQRRALGLDNQDEAEDDVEPVIRTVKPVQFTDPEIEGQPSVTATLEKDGKIYEGVLYFVSEVEK